MCPDPACARYVDRMGELAGKMMDLKHRYDMAEVNRQPLADGADRAKAELEACLAGLE